MNALNAQRLSDKSGLTAARIALLVAGRASSSVASASDDKGSVVTSDAQQTSLWPADQAIARRLEQLGYTVDYELGENPDANKAYDKAVVFISSTLKLRAELVQSFCDELNEIPTPVIVSLG